MLRLRVIAVVSLSFRFTVAFAFAAPGAAPAAGNRIPVAVTSVAEDRMAKRLASAVVKEFKRDPRFTLAERGSPRTVNVSLPARVGWERRLDWTEITYQTRLTSADGHSRVVAGQCWNWNLAGCAKQIADATAEFGSD